ncbi:hypothetical protein ACFQJ7_12430 [Halovenus rubra]|uniref:Uncharacterized protein n=2 Tax=Halovenus rubra TaxID=869890 RepID=A0ABD5X6E2_9EURY|nr:hypothetical protein [Halovenus rubra]
MQRREILASGSVALSTSVSDCLGYFGDDEKRGSVRITEVSPDPQPTLSVSPEVSITDAVGDKQSPASIRVAWTNETDDTVTLSGKYQMIFTAQTSEEGNVRLLGEPGNWNVEFDGCWHMTGPIGTDGAYPSITFEPGEVHQGTSGIYASDESCLSSGEYRFKISINEQDSPHTNDQGVTDWWGFVLEIVVDK